MYPHHARAYIFAAFDMGFLYASRAHAYWSQNPFYYVYKHFLYIVAEVAELAECLPVAGYSPILSGGDCGGLAEVYRCGIPRNGSI